MDALLREILDVSQDDPVSRRRWFHDEYFDLFLRENHGKLVAFELCYGLDSSERALVWSSGHGYFHDGDASNGDVIGARLAAGKPLRADPIVARFERSAEELPEGLRLALRACLREYAQHQAEVPARRARFRREAWQAADGEENPKRARGKLS